MPIIDLSYIGDNKDVYKFKTVSIGLNSEFIVPIIKLNLKYKSIVYDDYAPRENKEIIRFIFREIQELSPYFIAVTCNDEFMGYVQCTDWYGCRDMPHSCSLHVLAEKKFLGKQFKESSKLFFDYLFNIMLLHRIEVKIPAYNKRTLKYVEDVGFIKEGVERNGILKNGKLFDCITFSIIKEDFNNGKKEKEQPTSSTSTTTSAYISTI